MAIYTNLPIYKDTYTLLLTVAKAQPSMPRDARYTLGQDLRHALVDMLMLIYKANGARHKRDALTQLATKVQEVKVYLRLLCDMRYVSERFYLMCAEQAETVSKQAGRWLKFEGEKAERQ